jgi:CRP-like cAMP-binding protein
MPLQAMAAGERLPATTHRMQVDTDQLAAVHWLHPLAPAQLQQIAQRATVRRLVRHAMVVEQGSRDTSLYLLLKGQAQLVRRNQRGRSLVLDALRPGDPFGELSAIDGAPQYASVRCVTACDVLVIARNDFIDLLHASPAWMQAVLRGLVVRVRRKQRRIALLALHDVRGCVVQQLHELADVQDGQHVVQGRICRQAIADMIGASRAMVSRVMMALTRSGELQLLPDGSTLLRCQADTTPPRPASRRAARGGAKRSPSGA